MSGTEEGEKANREEKKEDKIIGRKQGKTPPGIDNRGESTRRYGKLEPEGYTRHVHGNREGEYQKGGKPNSEVPVEESTPFRDVRYRKDPNHRRWEEEEYSEKRFSGQGDEPDLTDEITKKESRD